MKPIKIVACVKQVPSEGGASMDPEKGLLIRAASLSAANPLDVCALEVAARILDAFGGELAALSMGPSSASSVLTQAFAMGAVRAVLLCDPAFAGSDVYATSFTLAQGIKKLGGADLILCGQQTTDGDTAQTPFALAAHLGIPSVGWVKRVEISTDSLIFVQELSGASAAVFAKFPMVAAIGREAAIPRMPSLKAQLEAKRKTIETWGLEDLNCRDKSLYGLVASPTRVKRVYAPSMEKKAEIVRDPAGACAEIIAGLIVKSRDARRE
ncbi:MAG: electron transfer flavoprotein subunit beta/FixA family protein [Clostridiales bacterium]|jgi:electron transfer flavoprotein beta subunit|nr:electron transfer flavoprotein subunit beta/FixA family protein [Clostridiales bacterium]